MITVRVPFSAPDSRWPTEWQIWLESRLGPELRSDLMSDKTGTWYYTIDVHCYLVRIFDEETAVEFKLGFG